MIVKRGPQLVQLMNGWRKRRSPGSNSSARQSSQVAVSGEIRVWRSPPGSLGTITKSPTPRGRQHLGLDAVDDGERGAPAASAARKLSSAAGSPSTSMKTPPVSLPTRPPSPRPGGQPVDVGAESHPLDHALHRGREPAGGDGGESLIRSIGSPPYRERLGRSRRGRSLASGP